MTPPVAPSSTSRPGPTTSRRAVLAVLGLSFAGFAGCASTTGDGPDPVPTPIALDGGKQDDQGGMVIGGHFGPNGQVFYRDHTPSGHDNPAWFHTLAHGLFPYYFEHERLGWEAVAVYVTDYSRVDYTLLEEGDRTYISTHTAAPSFADAHETAYVAGSRVLGGMGVELIPFGDRADAEAFRDDHGGSIVGFDDVSQELLTDLRRGADS